MATREEIYTAIRNADKAGDSASVQKLGAYLATMDAPEPAKAEKSTAENVVMGGLRGAKDVIDTGAEFLAKGWDKLTGGDKPTLRSLVTGEPTGEAARVRKMNEAGKKDFEKDYGDSTAASVARVGGNVLATLPVGGVLGTGAKLAGATRLGNALASGGMTTAAEVAPNALARAADMGIRMAGGAGTGYVSAGLVDPDSANTGAVVGAAMPPVAKLAGAAGDAAAAFVRPFFSKGQDRIAGDALRKFATNPTEALQNLRNVPEMIPGSAPTAVAAAGDEGLAGLSRTLQSANPAYAAELSSRLGAQNAARTAAMENVAGNTGKLALAREARDAVTKPMREGVLDAAGKLPAQPVLDSIDRLMADPNNAGKLAQSALADFKGRIAQWAPEGQINARALYAIRKDINDVLEGKLQGDAGNMRYASGQLVKVKSMIDEAIDQASRKVEMSSGRELMPAGANIERAGSAGPYGSSQPRPTWKGYLDKYTQESIPINQMEKLDEVLKGISTGTVDKSGNAVLSAAKLNNLLRNQAQDLQKVLSPEQLDLLRRLSADLNAGQLAATSGKAVGSNTVQNLSGVNALSSLVGNTLGGSSAMQSTAGRAINWLYKKPDEQVMNKLSQAMLDPQEAARLLQSPEGNALVRALNARGAQIGYRAAPALAAQ